MHSSHFLKSFLDAFALFSRLINDAKIFVCAGACAHLCTSFLAYTIYNNYRVTRYVCRYVSFIFCLVFGQITINKSRWCCMIINCFCVIFDTLYLSHLDLIRYIIDTFILWFIISREGGRIFENCCNIYTGAPDRQGFEVSWLRGFQAFRALEASRLQDFDTAFASMYW